MSSRGRAPHGRGDPAGALTGLQRPVSLARTSKVKHILKLKEPLEQLYQNYSYEYLKSDPLWFAHQYKDPLDQELVAFIASAFAYGSVPQIFKGVESILKPLGSQPLEKLKSISFKGVYKNFSYRFHKENELKIFLQLLAEVYRRYHSLKKLFQKHYRAKDENISESLSSFVDEILSFDASAKNNSKITFLFSSPRRASSCKRMNLFLRWMVRRGDKLDLGFWDFVSPSQLVIPLDTHIQWVASALGLTQRKSPNWKMAEEITQNLKLLDPEDPVKYDFALTRLGILGLEPPESLKSFF